MKKEMNKASRNETKEGVLEMNTNYVSEMNLLLEMKIRNELEMKRRNETELEMNEVRGNEPS